MLQWLAITALDRQAVKSQRQVFTSIRVLLRLSHDATVHLNSAHHLHLLKFMISITEGNRLTPEGRSGLTRQFRQVFAATSERRTAWPNSCVVVTEDDDSPNEQEIH